MTVQVSPEIQGRLSEMYGKLIYKYCIYKSVANISKRHLTISCFIVQRFLKNLKKKNELIFCQEESNHFFHCCYGEKKNSEPKNHKGNSHRDQRLLF